MAIKKMKCFSMRVGLSLALIGGFLAMQTESVQAQVSSDNGNGSSTSDIGTASPNLVPSVRRVIPRITTNQYVANSFNILSQLQANNYPISSSLQQDIGTVLTNSTLDSENSLTSTLNNEGLTQNQANQIVESMTNLFSDIDSSDEGGNFEEDIPLRASQADKLGKAIETYNQVVRSLNNETLQNPPDSLLTIRSILVEASQATRQQ
jgi:hypothetical protein